MPGPAVQTDAEILEAVRNYSESDFHAVGTCKMGVDAAPVVHPRARLAASVTGTVQHGGRFEILHRLVYARPAHALRDLDLRRFPVGATLAR